MERGFQLPEVGSAAGARREVPLESEALPGRQRMLEIIRHELDELAAGEVTGERRAHGEP
jgi:hypothetical protein